MKDTHDTPASEPRSGISASRGGAPSKPIAWAQEALLLAWITLILCGFDQWTKGWAQDALGPLERGYHGRLRPPLEKDPIEVIPGAFRFSITGNEGAIWGLGRHLSNAFKRPFFISMSLIAMLFIGWLIRSSAPDQRLRRIGLAAILSGALGNLIDRVRQDYVIDFLDWYLGYNWPTFNVADVAISVGVGLVIIDLWLHPDPVPEPALDPSPDAPADPPP